ncbi:uncharacterized protein LOC127856053 isoform X2 [Dreissena polymorpha]|uniref:uncharacterized protein LOC127856053 isoform X2 n=1 Tax=Dreissena polymorpha TaxID=45954 RepID=UPI002263DF5F|nr:uncharacterized protein LOC127856053 isoform X2 [Dreissena polymorpha]
MDQPTFVDGFHDHEAVAKMQYNPLGTTGMAVSELSLGTSAFGSVFRPTDDSECLAVLDLAVRSGVNLIDSAPWYGHGKAETILGRGLQKISRSAYYLATKVGRYQPEVDKMFDFRAERVIASVDESLNRLGLDYVDVIQVHDMEFAPSLDVILHETLPALQKVKDSGKARFIGITGYPLENFKTVLTKSSVRIDTVLTYCRGSMNDNSLQEYMPFFKERGVGVINASALGMGLLSNRGPASWHPAQDDIKDACAEAAKYCKDRNVDISRLALKFTLGQPGVASTLISTARYSRFHPYQHSQVWSLPPLSAQPGIVASTLISTARYSRFHPYQHSQVWSLPPLSAQPGIVASTLISTASVDNMKANLEFMVSPLTDNEETIMQEVLEKYMYPLKNKHWEGIEVHKYRTKLAGAADI